MKQLADHRGPLAAATLSKPVQTLNDAIAASIEKGIFEVVTRVYGHTFHDDQTDPTTRTRQVVGDQVLADHTLTTQRGTVRRIENPVTYPGWPKVQGLQYLLVHTDYMMVK